MNHLGTERAAVVVIPRGSGRVLISGLLDGWRFRAENNGAFERFWTGVLADAALQSPPPLAIQIDPAVAAPGQPIRIHAIVRETEWSRGPRGIGVPVVAGSIHSSGGRAEMIRLWPAAAPGVYRGFGRRACRAGISQCGLRVRPERRRRLFWWNRRPGPSQRIIRHRSRRSLGPVGGETSTRDNWTPWSNGSSRWMRP